MPLLHSTATTTLKRFLYLSIFLSFSTLFDPNVFNNFNRVKPKPMAETAIFFAAAGEPPLLRFFNSTFLYVKRNVVAHILRSLNDAVAHARHLFSLPHCIILPHVSVFRDSDLNDVVSWLVAGFAVTWTRRSRKSAKGTPEIAPRTTGVSAPTRMDRTPFSMRWILCLGIAWSG